MSNKTRKRLWPASLVMAVAIVGVVAAFLMMASSPTNTQAHDGETGAAHCEGLNQFLQDLHDASAGDHTCDNPPQATMEPTTVAPEDAMDMIASSSTSASSNVKLTLDIAELPMDLADGSSIVLYLEDDYKVPDTIDADDVYFIVPGSTNQRTNNGGRVFATYDVEISDDDHFGGDDDWDIQIFVPDFDTRDVDNAAGFQGPMEDEPLQLVITKGAGINNPSEAHDSNNTYTSGYKLSYAVLGPGASVPTLPNDKGVGLNDLFVRSKIALDDEDNDRGYELTVTGSGFNNGTSAAVHVLHNAAVKWWETLNCPAMKVAMGYAADDTSAEAQAFCGHFPGYGTPVLSEDNQKAVKEAAIGEKVGPISSAQALINESQVCGLILRQGSREGIATVSSDDKVAVTFPVTVPTFGAGDQNYICMADGEGRASVSDVEQFTLQDSLRIVPSSANAGDTINVFAQDFPVRNAVLTSLKISGQEVFSGNSDCDPCLRIPADPIGQDGSATATFDLPGSLGDIPLEGTLRIDAKWGDTSEDGKVTVTGSSLTVSKGEALPNEIITITGDGFGTGSGNHITLANITIDGVQLSVDEDSLDSDDNVDVSSAGQFVASVILWPHPDAEGGSNPTLIAGTHTIKVEDNAGFFGTAIISIPEPSISVTPGVAGPRDVVTITGENWPIDNIDGANPDAIDIEVDDGRRARRYSAFADSAGRFTIEHRVASDVAIPSTNQVRAEMGTDIVKVGSFEVPAAIISVEPAEGQPGDHITLSVDGMPVYQQVDRVEIGGRSVRPVGNFSTDADGSVTVTDVLIPGIDPGTYSVLLEVEDTIAIGSLDVLAESAAVGAAAMLPDAVQNLGDSLVAVFYFDDVGKTWSFYDPRPDFADLNTLSELVNGEAYWILVSETVEDVVLNNKARSLTCRGDDCWNLEVW